MSAKAIAMSDPGTQEAATVAPVRLTVVERGLELAALTMFVVVLLATLAQVFFRYFAEMPVPWTEELARALFVLSMLAAIALGYREREHVVVDFLFKRLPGANRCIVKIAFDVAILAFLVMWARGAIALMQLNWNATLITLPFFRVGYFYLWELTVIALMIVYVIVDIIRTVRTGEATYTRNDRTQAP